MAPSSQTWAAAAGAAFACTLLPKAFVPSGPVAGPAAQPGEAELRLGLAAPATAAGSEQATGLGLAASAAGGIAVLALAARRRGVAPRQAADVVVDLERAGGVARRAFEGELGVQAPVGFWDPLGLASDGDVNTFKRRRAVELKHGRISMLACIGYIVPEYAKFPGYVSPSLGLKFADVPSGLGALSKVPIEGLLQIALFLGHYEGFFWRQDPARAPGDYEGYGFLGIGNNFIFSFTAPTIDDPDARQKKLSAELANGRLAMVAIIGMFYQDGLTGSAWGDWSLYTSSPLR